MEDSIQQQVESTIRDVDRDLLGQLREFFSSSGEGGKKIINAFMKEFYKLSERSPEDDPTNLKNYMGVIRSHIERTLDESLEVTDDGQVKLGIGTDSFLGFDEKNWKLKHRPVPVVWVVYLIRGIAGPYAFVGEGTYFKKFGRSMPTRYAGGFLISRAAWRREGWDQAVGPFEQFRHPASGAPPVPFFRNVLANINFQELMKYFFERYGYDTSDS